MSQTYYSENQTLDQMFGAVAISGALPASWHVGLLTAGPSEASGGGTEVSGGAYARVEIANNKTTTFGNASNGQLTNDIAITFPESTLSWGTVTHVAFYDASTSGNMWYYHLLSPSKIVDANTTVYFSAGSLTISNRN